MSCSTQTWRRSIADCGPCPLDGEAMFFKHAARKGGSGLFQNLGPTLYFVGAQVVLGIFIGRYCGERFDVRIAEKAAIGPVSGPVPESAEGMAARPQSADIGRGDRRAGPSRQPSAVLGFRCRACGAS